MKYVDVTFVTANVTLLFHTVKKQTAQRGIF